MSTDLSTSENPRKWRFTWESQSHIPSLKLYLFNSNTKPSTQCIDLKVNLFLEQSLLKVSWFEAELELSFRVPIPKVLIDFESPFHFKALDDHIEVKVALLLPIDHPIVSTLDSVLNLSPEKYESFSRNAFSDELKPLLMDSDLESLSSTGGVHFYCRSCSTKLTTSLRLFEEMPSVNWREVADNWFGNCCCSFGGISEKLVTGYAKSYTSTPGVCLLNTTSVVLCKDDLVGYGIPKQDGNQKKEHELDFASHNCLKKSDGSKYERAVSVDSQELDFASHNCLKKSDGSKYESSVSVDSQAKGVHDIGRKLSGICLSDDNLDSKVEHEVIIADTISHLSQTLEDKETVALPPGFFVHTSVDSQVGNDIKCCALSQSEPSAKDQESKVFELLQNQKSFLNGYLGNVFMTRSSNISKDVHWVELLCPQCSCLLGAYPCDNVDAPFDSGVHLFKCYISTCLDVGVSCNLFRKYTLERMFTNLLLESAKDELSFRTVVRDLQTKQPMLQVVLLNPSSWCCSGYCLSTVDQVLKVNMYPTIKLLFSDCSKSNECQLRMIEEWTTKNQADEVYMLASQIKELIGSLELINNILPPSHTLLHAFSLSSMRR